MNTRHEQYYDEDNKRWTTNDWDRRPSQLAEEAANRMWDMTLSEIYANHPDPYMAESALWFQEALYAHWLKDQEGNE
jgi:hypothetical protein